MSEIKPEPRTVFPLLALCMLLIAGCGMTADHRPAAPEDLTVRRVWPVPGYSKDKLFDAARTWVAKSFSTDLDVIQYANRREGIVVGETFIPYQRRESMGLAGNYDLRFTITVEVKKDRVRTTFTNLRLVEISKPEALWASDVKPAHKRLLASVESWIKSLKADKREKNW